MKVKIKVPCISKKGYVYKTGEIAEIKQGEISAEYYEVIPEVKKRARKNESTR